MKKFGFLSIFLGLMLILNGCNASKPPATSDTAPLVESIKINERTLTVREINTGIKNTFNTKLYYHYALEQSPFFNQSIEYDLFYVPKAESVLLPQICVIITNMEHPLSTEQDPKLYKFGVAVTEYGLQSYFSEESYVHPLNYSDAYLENGATYLGTYSMCINEVTQPVHEAMTAQWEQQAEAALRMYMDENNFSSEENRNLQAGKYNVYIQGFSAADVDTTVVFEHENGQVYMGQYYFVHHISVGTSANLNHVEQVEDMDANFKEYLNRLRSNAALKMEYMVA